MTWIKEILTIIRELPTKLQATILLALILVGGAYYILHDYNLTQIEIEKIRATPSPSTGGAGQRQTIEDYPEQHQEKQVAYSTNKRKASQ